MQLIRLLWVCMDSYVCIALSEVGFWNAPSLPASNASGYKKKSLFSASWSLVRTRPIWCTRMMMICSFVLLLLEYLWLTLFSLFNRAKRASERASIAISWRHCLVLRILLRHCCFLDISQSKCCCEAARRMHRLKKINWRIAFRLLLLFLFSRSDDRFDQRRKFWDH